jgi:predicted phosphodiesterase
LSQSDRPVLFCGDPHGQFEHIVCAALNLNACAVILVGDMEAVRPLHVELRGITDRVWFVHGNHDTDHESNWSAVWESDLRDRNLHGVVTVLPNGLKAAGLGGVFRERVWNRSSPESAAAWRSPAEHARSIAPRERWRGRQPLTHWSTIYPADVDSLSRARADILVLHEAPGYHPRGVELLDDLARAMGVKVVVHGHHHDALDSSSRWASQGFISHGIGLRGITAIDSFGVSTVVVPGELDASRRDRPIW